jgi:hypothetical protein
MINKMCGCTHNQSVGDMFDIHGIAKASLAISYVLLLLLAVSFAGRSSQSEYHERFPFSSHRTWCMVPRRMGRWGLLFVRDDASHVREGQEIDVDLFRTESKSSKAHVFEIEFSV